MSTASPRPERSELTELQAAMSEVEQAYCAIRYLLDCTVLHGAFVSEISDFSFC